MIGRWLKRQPRWVQADALALAFEGAIKIGLISGAALAAALGQIILAGLLILLALGLALRFKRGRLPRP